MSFLTILKFQKFTTSGGNKSRFLNYIFIDARKFKFRMCKNKKFACFPTFLKLFKSLKYFSSDRKNNIYVTKNVTKAWGLLLKSSKFLFCMTVHEHSKWKQNTHTHTEREKKKANGFNVSL